MASSSDDTDCRLCETLRLTSRWPYEDRSATARELEAASSCCSLCRILFQVVQHFAPDSSAKEKGILHIIPVPEDALTQPNLHSSLYWLPEPWKEEAYGIYINAFRIDGMCVSNDAIVVCPYRMHRKSSC